MQLAATVILVKTVAHARQMESDISANVHGYIKVLTVKTKFL